LVERLPAEPDRHKEEELELVLRQSVYVELLDKPLTLAIEIVLPGKPEVGEIVMLAAYAGLT